jgi:hypothetical protein
MPSGTVTPATGAVKCLGPFAVTYQTANIANPADAGALVGPVLAAGTLVLAAWLKTTTPWVAATSVDEFIISLQVSTASFLDVSSAAAINANTYSLSLSGAVATPQLRWVGSGTDQLGLGIFTTGALTAGAGSVYALIVST